MGRTEPLKHTFEYDAELSKEWDGRQWCRRCGLPGKPGDRRHFGSNVRTGTAVRSTRRATADWAARAREEAQREYRRRIGDEE